MGSRQTFPSSHAKRKRRRNVVDRIWQATVFTTIWNPRTVLALLPKIPERHAEFGLSSTTSPSISPAPAPAPGSTFWFAVVRHDEEDLKRLPCVPTLDADGPLPPAAYLTHGDPQNHPKATCRIATALSLDEATADELEPTEIVSALHRYIDHGITSFQIQSRPIGLRPWTEESVYGRLWKETPLSVLNRCQLTVPMSIPGRHAVGITPSLLRKTVIESMARIDCEAIDVVQVEYEKDSPYFLEVLDCLQDLKRDGLVRSVAGRKVPANMLRLADRCGFSFDINQIPMNLLDPNAYNAEMRLAADDLGIALLLESPLAGGLLTNRYLQQPRRPYPWSFTKGERHHLRHTLPVWNKLQPNPSNEWQNYQELLQVLDDLALKYSVSIASIVLRWSLQLEHVGGVVVASAMVENAEMNRALRLKPRTQLLRQVFTFQLDDDDMEMLWKVSGRDEPEVSEFDEEAFMDMMERGNGLVLPKDSGTDSSKRKLWL